jgi:hypothetical protein
MYGGATTDQQGGPTMAASNSPRAHTRRHVLKVLAAIKQATSYQQQAWTTTSTVYERHPDGPSRNSTRRDRRADEYPENQAEYWEGLDAYLTDLINGASSLRAYAREMVVHVRETSR